MRDHDFIKRFKKGGTFCILDCNLLVCLDFYLL